MGRAEFNDFIRRQKSASDLSETPFDPQRELEEWRRALASLYDQVKRFMAEYLEKGLVKIVSRDITLNEEFSGPYTIPEMTLDFGQSIVTLRPVGTMLIGSKGRVDVRGPRGTARLGLVGKDVSHASQLVNVRVAGTGASTPEPDIDRQPSIEWAWKIIKPAPDMRFIALTEDNFFDLILSVVDG